MFVLDVGEPFQILPGLLHRRVRRGKGREQEERLVLVAPDEPGTLVALIVGEIAERFSILESAQDRTRHGRFTTGFRTEVIMRATKPTPELVEAAVGGVELRTLAEMPLAHEARRVSELPESVRQGGLTERQAHGLRIMPRLNGAEIVVESKTDRIFSGHQFRTRQRANGDATQALVNLTPSAANEASASKTSSGVLAFIDPRQDRRAFTPHSVGPKVNLASLLPSLGFPFGKELARMIARPHSLAHSMADDAAPMAWLTRRDGSVLMGYGPFTAAAGPPADGVAFHVQDFALRSERPWRIPASHECLTFGQLEERFPAQPPINPEWRIPDAAPFSVVFQEVMSSIRSGVFEKTVPVVTETGFSAVSPAASVAAAMCRQHLPLLSYGWIDGDSGFAGATPELLLSVEDHHLETMALAGTARSEDRDAFAVDEKEIREHEYVAQTLVSKLLDLGTLKRHPREILHLGSIVHFLTRIEVELRGRMAPDELIRRLHPTPALGPLPRTDVTLSKLLEWRKRLGCPDAFGAPFGVWENGRFCCVVAIRGIWWSGSEVQIPSGCGVIEASRLVNEWRELRLKREAVKNGLGLPGGERSL